MDATARISVVRDNRIVPLIPTHHAAKKLAQPWKHILMERHTVGAIEIPEHVHHEFCLHLQLRGNEPFEWWSEGRNRLEPTAPGAMILLAPGTRDRLHWQGASERLIVSLDPALLPEAASFRNQWSLHDPAIERLLREMERERAAGWPLGSLYADLLAINLAGLMLQRHAAGPAAPASTEGQLPMPRLRRALVYMNDQLARDLTLEEIAAQLNLSPFHFTREFRRTTGQTPYQYLLDQRIAKARSLLKDTHFSIAEIGRQTGFPSPVNFTRTFRQRTGQTPDTWRNNR